MADQTASDRISGYADAVLAVAHAEGAQAAVEAELARFAAALRSSDELQSTLADSVIDVERRLRITEDLLGGRALPATAALVSLVVGAGRGGELVEIIDAAIDRAAAGRNRRVARVRSAVDLTGEQRTRLAEAIKASSGLDVEIPGHCRSQRGRRGGHRDRRRRDRRQRAQPPAADASRPPLSAPDHHTED